MKRSLIAASLGLLALLNACGSRTDQGAVPITSDPAPVVTHTTVNNTMQGQLPPISELDSLRSASVLFNMFTVVASSDATVGAGGELTMNAPLNGFAWIVFDLGNQAPGFSIGSVSFTNADWSGITPAPRVFSGVTDYTNGIWRFRRIDPANYTASFNGLPAGISFISPGNRSYLAIITDMSGLSCGNDVDIAVSAGPGGDLPADFSVDFPGMPDRFGLNNALIVRPDNSGGDIVTYCPDADGGALVRFTYNSGTDSLSTVVKTQFDAGNAELLAACHAYRLDYYSDGRLGIGAARKGPNAIRTIAETAPGSHTLGLGGSLLTAVDNSMLPVNFDVPHYDYKIDADDEPHCLFKTSTGTLGYAYYVAGSWGTDTGGPAVLGNIALRLIGTDTLVAYQAESGVDTKVAINRMLQYPAGVNFGSSADVSAPVGMSAGESLSMALGTGNSIHIAHRLFDGGNGQLDFGYRPNAVIGDVWTNTTADSGGAGDDDVGASPSIGILRDGTPVIAYFDITNLSLCLAISSTPDGGNVTGAAWDNYLIDTSVLGSQVGIHPALGVIQRSDPDPDKVIVAYGVQDGGSNKLRIILLDAPASAT